jgi:triacylglycerol esterase/lipase EstA (alpha/beta hydrolase family)
LTGCLVASALGFGVVAGTAARVEARPLEAEGMHCPAELGSGPEPVVVLVHGTGSSVRGAWSWSYQRALVVRGFDLCSVELVDRGNADIQASAARVAEAVDALAGTGRRVTLLRHSQGGLVARAVLRWWPALRPYIDDVVMLGTPNRGMPMAELACLERCVTAFQQMRTESRFLAALNAVGDAAGDVSFTSVATVDDGLVPPDRARLDGAENIVVQDLCPGRAVGHSGLVGDAAAFAIAVDAMTNRGPARVDRLDADCEHTRAVGMLGGPPPPRPSTAPTVTAEEPPLTLGP